MATADFPEVGGPGRMRADYVLPSAGLTVRALGIVWPGDGDPFLPVVQAASRHRLVWVYIETD